MGEPRGARIYDWSQTRRERGEGGEVRAGVAGAGEKGGEEEERGGEDCREREEQREAAARGECGAAGVEVHCHGLICATWR